MGRLSQLPFGWVCFSNCAPFRPAASRAGCLNCLSAGSVSLTQATGGESRLIPIRASQLPFGWVCFSN